MPCCQLLLASYTTKKLLVNQADVSYLKTPNFVLDEVKVSRLSSLKFYFHHFIEIGRSKL
jgi:hypothetical protein